MWPVNHPILNSQLFKNLCWRLFSPEMKIGARKPLKFDGFLDSNVEILKGTCCRVNFGCFEVYDPYNGLRHM